MSCDDGCVVDGQPTGGAAAVSALDWKESCRVATTGPGTLATDFEAGDTIDGVVLAAGNRILIKDQVSGAENGIYVVQASGAPIRAPDADTDSEVTSGMATYIEEGTANAETVWFLTTPDPITLGVTALVFAELATLTLCTSLPSALSVGSTGVIGVGPDASPCDHEHPIPVGTPVSIVDSGNAPGVAATFVRSDHVHEHGSRGGGTLHALATTVTAGFMSAADKTKLDGITPGATTGVIDFGSGNLLGAGTTTRYLWPSNTNAGSPILIQEMDAPRAGTIRNLFVRVGRPSGATAATVTYTLMVNGVASALTVTMVGSAASGSDTANSVVVAQGDRLAIRAVKSAGLPGTIREIDASMEIAA